MNPHATNHPISYFRKYHQQKLLDLSPAFQRNSVWTDEQASYLIDSVLNGLPIPELYVRSTTDEEGETALEVVDGQQRLRSLISFFSNDLPLEGENVTDRWKGTSWETLSPEQQRTFWAYKLVVRELEGASDVEVRDMFRRLNANQSSLNAQELRHSQYHGEFIKAVESLADDRWWLDNKIVTPAQTRRMVDVEFISELLVAVMSGPLDKKIGLDEYYKDYDSEFPDAEYWRDLFTDTRNLTKRLAGGDLKGWTSKTEYYSLFVAAGRCAYEESVPSPRTLPRAVKRLAEFRAEVNQAKRRDPGREFDENITAYVQAATRASTDLSRREARIQIIYGLIGGRTKPLESTRRGQTG